VSILSHSQHKALGRALRRFFGCRWDYDELALTFVYNKFRRALANNDTLATERFRTDLHRLIWTRHRRR
jgi:hypothetical protein